MQLKVRSRVSLRLDKEANKLGMKFDAATESPAMIVRCWFWEHGAPPEAGPCALCTARRSRSRGTGGLWRFAVRGLASRRGDFSIDAQIALH
ncbi:hypothetical protein EYF80_055795 [Liparis tanakae]|uniref:Uncharacterized protein n=1 Tax=Liparis tanakae TaxID=230148 RepID=A0A4Z2EZK2_9TELE|nr:hypothetical protein EYF80_055795 [Liparis tanakae]